MAWAEDMGFDGYPDLVEISSGSFWVTQEGKNIPINEMTDSHLYYAYRKFNDDRLAREMLLRLFKERHGIK